MFDKYQYFLNIFTYGAPYLAIDSMQLTCQNGFARSLSGGYKMTNGSHVRKLFFKTGRSNQGSIVRGRDQ